MNITQGLLSVGWASHLQLSDAEVKGREDNHYTKARQ